MDNHVENINRYTITSQTEKRLRNSSFSKRCLIIFSIITSLIILIILILLFVVFNIQEEKQKISIQQLYDKSELTNFIDFNPNKLYNSIPIFNDKSMLRRFSVEDISDTKCLDGSDYGVYYGPGRNQGKNKVLVSFEGQGWCYDLEERNIPEICRSRTNNFYGSSETWKKEYIYNEGFYSGDESKNKQFHNWHRFIIPYCDGTGNQGHVQDPINVAGKDLYFRGYKNTFEAFKFIFQHVDINNLETVVLTGCSSGAWSAFQWLGSVESYLLKINSKIIVLGIMNGGYFIDYKSIVTKNNDFLNKFKVMYKFANNEIPAVNKECIKDFQDKPYMCQFPHILVDYIKSPILMFQFQYDSWQIWEILEEKCVNDTKSLKNCDINQRIEILKLREFTKNNIKNALRKNKNLSIFSPSCVMHCFSSNQLLTRDIVVKNFNIDQVMTNFLNDNGKNQIILIDDVDWPNNKGCANEY